ncbi:tetratricopeptide repeat protein [Breznakiellaceae bacterium SP9]
MKTMIKLLFAALCLLFASCASMSMEGFPLDEAIEQSADKIAGDLPSKSRVAIVAFESENDNLSDYIMEELTGALLNRKVEVADRQNLEYVCKEINYQMSGDVSDESAQSIGRQMGAQLVIIGQLIDVADRYRFRVNAIHVERATRDGSSRLDVRNDQRMKNMVEALATQKTRVRTAKYGVTEQTVPTTPGRYLDRGFLFASRGKDEQATKDFTEAVNMDPDFGAGYSSLGRASYKKGDYDQAIAYYDKVIKLDPNDAVSYYYRGLAYYNKRNYDRAIADYDKVIKLNPKYTVVYTNRGLAYKAKGDNERAIADYNKAIEFDPNDAAAYSNRGIAYRAQGDNDQAIADYDKAIEFDSNDAAAYSNRGIAYYSKGDYDRAIADYTQAITLDSNYAAAYYHRGNAYKAKGDRAKARTDSQAKGEYDRAIADYTQAITLDPNDADAYYQRGLAYNQKGQKNEAIQDLEKAIRTNPNYEQAKARLNGIREGR